MAKPPSVKYELARKYRNQYGREKPTAALAQILHEENPLLFKSKENARVILSQIEGKRLGTASKIKITHAEPPRTTQPYHLPEPDGDDLEPYRLPLSWNDFIFASDFHVPNHRTEPIKAMLDYAIANGVKKLIVGGDLLDNTPFSRWLHEPVNPKDVPLWFDMAKELLVQFKKVFEEVIWIEGNHDFWYKRFLMVNAPLLFNDKHFQLEARLGLNDIGVKFIDQRYLVKAGHLNIHHGHVLLRGSGTYANGARMLYMKAKSNFISGHLHVESSHTEPNVDDKIATTFITGCMCTLRPEYQPFGGKACHGFAHIKVEKDKNFSVRNYRIYKGKIL